ncbi:MAG: hypothetical protein VXZ72_00865 [Chlamydiota bacterium]|nr:hypothetical protein [Chlamydiota bacterium]
MYRKVDPDTPTADLLALRSSKPFLIELAQEVFGMRGSKVLHAFRQFDPHALAKIIDAKREGIWNYGEHIEQIQGGYKYPRAEDALSMLEEAMGITPEEVPAPQVEVVEPEPEEPLDSLEAEQNSHTHIGEGMGTRDERKAELEAMNKRPLQQLHLAVTGNRSKRGEAAEHLIERILDIEFSSDTTSPVDTEEVDSEERGFDPRPAGPTVVINTVSPEPEEEQVDDSSKNVVQLSDHVEQEAEDNEVSEEDSIGLSISDAVEEAVESYMELSDSISRARAGIRGVFVLVDVMLRRQELMAQRIFGDTAPAGWPEVPQEGVMKDFDLLIGNEPEDPDEIPPVSWDEEEAATPEPEPEPEPELEVVNNVHYLSEAEIRNLPESELYEYAESLGIENARAVAFTPFLVRDVLKKIKSMSAK